MRILYILILVIAPNLHSFEIKTRSENEAKIKSLIDLFSSPISERCNFDKNQPLYVPVSGKELTEQLASRKRKSETTQYLLLSKDYYIDTNLQLDHKANICGLNDWLLSSIYFLANSLSIGTSDFLNGDFSGDRVFSGDSDFSGAAEKYSNTSLCHTEIADFGDNLRQKSCHKAPVTRLSLSTNNSKSPSILVVENSEFKHLYLQRYAAPDQQHNPDKYGLISTGCYADWLVCEPFAKANLTLNNVILEDLLETSDFLLVVFESSRFYAQDVEFNFSHRTRTADYSDSSNHHSFNKTLFLYWTQDVHIKNARINNFGDRGVAIYWAGAFWLEESAFIINTEINSSAKGGITGIKLSDTVEGKGFKIPLFSKITMNSGINVGFDIDDKFRIRAGGHAGNLWNSEGTRCKGPYDKCSLLFPDVISSSAASSLPTVSLLSSSSTPASLSTTIPSTTRTISTEASPTAAPTIRQGVVNIDEPPSSGAVRSVYHWGVLASSLMILLAAYTLT